MNAALITIFTLFMVADSATIDSSAYIGSIAVTESISAESVRVGDTLRVVYVMRFDTDPVYWVLDTIPPIKFQNLKPLGSRIESESHFEAKAKFGTMKLELLFTPKHPGEAMVFQDSAKFIHLPDSTMVKVLLKGFSVVALPSKMRIPLAPLGLTILGLGLFYMALAIMKKKSIKLQFREAEKPEVSPEETYYARLVRLSPQIHGHEKIIEELSRTLRKYIEERYGIKASGMSSDEILEMLSARIAGQKFILLKEILQFCDDVRFAGKYPTNEELLETIDKAKKFIASEDKIKEESDEH